MRIRLWGTRGSIAVAGESTLRYGGNTTCVEIDLACGEKIVIDAGTGIRALGEALSKGESPIHLHLLITHIHWDHIMGFPFFGPIFDPETRIDVDGNIRAYKGLKTLFENRMGDGFFPVKFDDLKADIRFLDSLEKGSREIGGARVDGMRLQHPGGGLGFRFVEDDKVFVFLTDNELREDAWEGCSPEDYAEFCKGADVLIHDCQYREDERQIRRGWGHSDTGMVLPLALNAGVKRLILYHHAPDRSDAQMDAMVEECRQWVKDKGGEFGVEGAKEGEISI